MTDHVRTLKSQNIQSLGDDGSTDHLGDVFDIPYGLIIVGVDKPAQLAIVSATFTLMAQRGSKRLGVRIPRGTQVISVCSGERHASQKARLLATNTHAENAAPHEIKNLGLNSPISCTSPESVFVFNSLMAGSGSWLMAEQTIASSFNTASSIGVLWSISKMAKKAKSRIVLFIAIPEGGEKYQLDQCCDEYIAVNSCEPDLEYHSAFSVDVASLRYLNGVSIGKTMCNVRYVNGVLQRRYAPFISGQVENRVIWALRAQGETLDYIAKIMKINKSTVLRRLQTMPPVRQTKGNDELISHYLNAPPAIEDISGVSRGGVVIKIDDENDEKG